MDFESVNKQEQVGENPERRRLKNLEMGSMFEGARNKIRAAGLVLATVAATAAAQEGVADGESSTGVEPTDKIENTQIYNEPYFERSDAFDASPSIERAHTLAERLGMDTDNLQITLEGHVPTEINGESVMHLLTDAEIEEVENARRLVDLMNNETEASADVASEPTAESDAAEAGEDDAEGRIYESRPTNMDAY